jgi:hypothetical protein
LSRDDTVTTVSSDGEKAINRRSNAQNRRASTTVAFFGEF